METEVNNETGMEEEAENGVAALPEDETARLKARLAELEKTIGEQNARVAELTESGRQREETRKTFESSLAEAVNSYKSLVTAANPAVPAELITGASIREIDASLDTARKLVLRVRQGIEAEMNGLKIPAGAPERSRPDLSGFSPIEKIKYGLGEKR